MDTQTLFNCGLIGLGAIGMLVSIYQSRSFRSKVNAVSQANRESMRLHFGLHQALMVFFLLGYLGAIAAVVLRFPLVSETFVSFVFLFGSVFVYMGVHGQLTLLNELANKKQND